MAKNRDRELTRLRDELTIDLSQPSRTRGRNVLVYGPTGSNKTGSFITLPDCALPAFMFDYDKGTEWLAEEFEADEFKALQAPCNDGTGYELTHQILSEWGADRGASIPYKTIILDSLVTLHESVILYVMEYEGKDIDDPTEDIAVRDRYRAQRLVRRLIDGLLLMPQNVIINCHERMERDGEQKIVQVMPFAGGHLGVEVQKLFGEVYHTEVVRGKNKDGVKFFWNTQHKEKFIGRTRKKNFPMRLEMDWGKVFDPFTIPKLTPPKKKKVRRESN